MKFLPKSRLDYRKALAAGTTGNPWGGTLAGRTVFNRQGAAQLLQRAHRSLTPQQKMQFEAAARMTDRRHN